MQGFGKHAQASRSDHEKSLQRNQEQRRAHTQKRGALLLPHFYRRNRFHGGTRLPQIVHFPRNPRKRRKVTKWTGYFDAVIGAGGSSGSRLASPRSPRTSTSSKRSEGATTDAGKPTCADPKALRAVPAKPFA